MSDESPWHATRWLNAIYDSDLKPGPRHVAEVYARFAGRGREARVYNSELRRRTAMGERTLQAHRRALVDGGWLVQVPGRSVNNADLFLLNIVIHSPADFAGPDGASPADFAGVVIHSPADFDVKPRRSRGEERKREEVTNSSSSSKSPTACAPDDDDERPSNEQDPRIVRLIAHHKPRNPTGWLRTITANGDLDRLIAELPPPTPAPITAWECPDHGHITTRRCGGCNVEIKTGQRPPEAHGQHYEAKETA